MTRIFTYSILIFLFFGGTFVGLCQENYHITGIQYWSAPDQTKIILDVSGKVTYKPFSLNNPNRFVIDFNDTTLSFPYQDITVKDGIVNQIRFGNFEKNNLRVVFDVVQPVEPNIFFIENSPDKTQRLSINLLRPDLKNCVDKDRVTMLSEAKNKKLIVIDPGHGGEDPGAIGPRKTKEKDIVLQFARTLKKMFDEKPGYQAVLTRNGDYFLPLKERTKIAENFHADLFISIHADSNHIKQTQGASVYCLSLKGASDEATRCLAEKENSSDLIVGIPFSENDDLNLTLLDLALTNNINSSLRYGALILKEIERIHSVKFEKPKQAAFRVLKTAEMPSVLIEIGFISNPVEEKALKQTDFQNQVGQAILAATDQFINLMAQKDTSPQNNEWKAHACTSQP
jgi:N-acetylmuramoyl-L-alanine amidase